MAFHEPAQRRRLDAALEQDNVGLAGIAHGPLWILAKSRAIGALGFSFCTSTPRGPGEGLNYVGPPLLAMSVDWPLRTQDPVLSSALGSIFASGIETMTVAAGSRLGPYEIVSLLGAGGMGEGDRARGTRLGGAGAGE